MTRYVLGVLAGFALLAAVWLGLFTLSLGLYENFGDRTVAAWYQIKREAADAMPRQPKIVLAGGSNVLYGLRAGDIEQALGVPCLNYGMHAALPLDYLIRRWEDVLERGDILVLSLEWPFLRRPPEEINDVFVGYLLGGDPWHFLDLPFSTQMAMALSASPRRLLLPLLLSRRENAATQNVSYEWNLAYYVDRKGDYLRNDPSQSDRDLIGDLLRRRPGAVVAPPDVEPSGKGGEAWRRIETLAKWAQKKGVRVVFAAPALLSLPAFSKAKYRKAFHAAEARFAAMGIPTISPQEQNFYAPELVFDSVYHLNREGASLRTRQLIEALRPLVKPQP